MPNYGVPQSGPNPVSGLNLTSIQPGEFLYLFNAESPTPAQASVAFSRGHSPSGDDSGVTFTIDFATAPTGGTVLIQGSNIDVDADYQTLVTSTGKQHDFFTDLNRFKYYRASYATVGSPAGGALTVIASR